VIFIYTVSNEKVPSPFNPNDDLFLILKINKYKSCFPNPTEPQNQMWILGIEDKLSTPRANLKAGVISRMPNTSPSVGLHVSSFSFLLSLILIEDSFTHSSGLRSVKLCHVFSSRPFLPFKPRCFICFFFFFLFFLFGNPLREVRSLKEKDQELPVLPAPSVQPQL